MANNPKTLFYVPLLLERHVASFYQLVHIKTKTHSTAVGIMANHQPEENDSIVLEKK